MIAARDDTNILSAVGDLTMRNTRRYGGYVVHFGMVLIFIGIAGSAFNKDIQMDMAPGQSLSHRPVHDSLPEFRSRSPTTIISPSAPRWKYSATATRDDALSRSGAFIWRAK